jgi:hypothetical protein
VRVCVGARARGFSPKIEWVEACKEKIDSKRIYSPRIQKYLISFRCVLLQWDFSTSNFVVSMQGSECESRSNRSYVQLTSDLEMNNKGTVVGFGVA